MEEITMSPKITFDQPGRYRIRIQGKLDERWTAYFGEMKIELQSDAEGLPVTILTGTLPDQAAVQGELQKLYNLGFPLIGVEKLE
jgi:hypothetical protein